MNNSGPKMPPLNVLTIARILVDNGFTQIQRPVYLDTFTIDLYDHHFTLVKGLKNFNVYDIYRQIKIDSRNEYVPYFELIKLKNMLINKDPEISYMALTMLSKLNLVYADQIMNLIQYLNEQINVKITYLIYERKDPYIIMYWLYIISEKERKIA